MIGLLCELLIIPILSLGRGNVADGLEEPLVVEPSYPLEGGEFQGFHRFPGRPAMDQFGLVKAVDGFGQGVVVAVALASNGRLDAGLGQSFGVAEGNVLGAAI